jgi:hypothetical protein
VTPCFECESPTDHDHHVVPRSLGGTKTVPLCHACHAKAHGLQPGVWANHRALTVAALERRKASGLIAGQVPFGKRDAGDGRLVDEPNEVRTMQRIIELWTGGVSIRKIATMLDTEEHRPRGARWQPTTVARIIKTYRSELLGADEVAE